MTPPDLATRIELFLLLQQGFVATRRICVEFAIKERLLRQDGIRPGLLDDFAVSSTKEGESGYIHHRYLPEADWKKIEDRLRKHGIQELRRVRRWRRARHNCLTGKRPHLTETHTGQGILL